MDAQTNARFRAAFDGIFTRMLQAEWLKDFTYTKGKGFHVRWQEAGTLAALELEEWIDALALDQADERPQLAHIFAQGGCALPGSASNAVTPVLESLLRAGWATHARMGPSGSEIAWTPAGVSACDRWVLRTAALGLHRDADADTLLALVHALRGWGPNGDTKIEFA